MKVQCLDARCKNVFVISRKERFRAARPKCTQCGNGQYEEYVKPEKQEKEDKELQEQEVQTVSWM